VPIYFPQLNSNGVITQLPYETSAAFRTTFSEVATGKRHAYSQFATPVFRFKLHYRSIPDSELTTLENFFNAREGRLGEFAFLDPAANLVTRSEDFADALWVKTLVTAGASVTDPFGGALAKSLAAAAGDAFMVNTVLPDAAGADAFVLCGSVWARALSAGQNIAIGFLNNLDVLLSQTTWALPQNAWKRVHHTITLATPAPAAVKLRIGGGSTWNNTTIEMFGAQAVPSMGPGAYAKTPGNPGLHGKCRFEADEFAVRYLGPNQNSVQLGIQEYR